MLLTVDRVAQNDFRRKIDPCQKKLENILESYPGTPVLQRFSPEWNTKNQWYRKHSRKVRKAQPPAAVVLWKHEIHSPIIHVDGVTGEETTTYRSLTITTPLQVYSFDQTRAVKKQARTLALEKFWEIFCEPSNSEFRVPYLEEGCKSWTGKIEEAEMCGHIAGERDYAVRMSELTRFVAIDLDLHEGCQNVFLQQLQVLLDAFWGKRTWHLQVKRHHAKGVHLIFVLDRVAKTDEVVAGLRKLLIELDEKNPRLAEAAKAAGMNSLASMEIKPTKNTALRLPLAAGRVMLLDKPLAEVAFRGKQQQDVGGYIGWLEKALDGTAGYMIKADVMEYVVACLPSKQKKEERIRSIIVPPQTQPIDEQPVTFGKSKTYGSSGNFRGMKGKTWQQLTHAWSGGMTADSLNHWIRQLSLYAPFKFGEEKQAVDAIEQFIDDLPTQGFSDRLSAGDRSNVSTVVQRCVKLAFGDWQGQPHPENSAKKLQAVWLKWQSTGRDPFNKLTWNSSSPASLMLDVELADNFDWTEDELEQLQRIAAILKTDLSKTAAAVKHLIRLIKVHPEVPRTWLIDLLNAHGVPARSKKIDKPRRLIEALGEIKWIYIEAKHAQGRCRRYGLGTMRKKYGSETLPINVGCDIEELYERLREAEPALCSGT